MSFHSHPCQFARFGCERSILCEDKNLFKNYDGWPEVMCSLEAMGISGEMACEDCEQDGFCEDCGAPNHLCHDEDCPFFERENYDVEVPIEFYCDNEYLEDSARLDFSPFC